ncbi:MULTISPECIES: hypothetical protein [unclassified Photobacterium]|uniref:hypothetical protein n=1 Tax=unclassified Photobacterium TaxID=2628852 RepID=UPI000D17DD1D|nr:MULTISPECIES: hypothetical protein [unclassified Photobacterium]PSV31547.1 hypothetical protein C9J40_08850 [Photobacterium sp. GB-72]PSV36834.1 hypothetical protein C9J38_12735 [Photobacterium sp. GB-210]PSV52542.1 hypothetical protein C9J45_11640 [Photobacterium sp. GB-1]PSW69152.1 hypothetical protein C9J41_21460 [Photobacterium sp. GB-50]
MSNDELLPLYIVISLVLFLFFIIFLYIQLSIKAKKDGVIGNCCVNQIKDKTTELSEKSKKKNKG